jgi:hypothetical protein
MKLVTQVSEHQPIAMCSCRRPDETDFVRLFSLTSYFTPAPIEDSLHISMLSPPQNDRVLMVGPRPGRPCNSERAYEVYSSCSLRQARSYRSTCTHPSPCTLCRGAQLEMMDAAVKAARRGLAVISVRPSLPPQLKQGDTAMYSRAGDTCSKFSSFTVISASVRHWQCHTCRHGIDSGKSDRNDILAGWRQCSVG